MISLTIGYVSGIIAAAIFVLQFLVPNALIVVLVGLLKNEHSAVTWSVVERNLLSSWWPLFLRSDSTASRGVDRNVSLLGWLRPLALGLITIAAVITPLGLYDDILPSRSQQLVEFAYVQDSGPMGYGTPPRSDLGFTRVCGGFLPAQCPGTTVEIITSGNDTVMEANITNDDYDTRIPRVLYNLYQSGLEQQPSTVSSFFDIQARQYSYQFQAGMLNNERYIVTTFRQLQSIVLNDAIEPLEGIIANTRTGGIGFRNHTVPKDSQLGAEWTEDLLWVEPETACVDTNVSIEFQIAYDGLYTNDLSNISLVDNGGFADLVTQYPVVDVNDAQRNPNLRDRAYKNAWMINAYSMLILNITRPSPNAFGYLNSKVGDKYQVVENQVAGVKRNGIYMTDIFTSLLDPDAYISNRSLASAPNANYSNPFSISGANYSSMGTLCSGAGGGDLANLTNIHVQCGLIFGAARRIDGDKSLVLEPLTWWTQSVYSCATTAKASIKQTRFRYNATGAGSDNLGALTVVDVTDKVYTDNASMPLWGVESPRNMTLGEVSQLWGLVSPDLENSANVSTIRAPHLYLPGYGGYLSMLTPEASNIPAATGFSNVLSGIWQTPLGVDGLVDYTGNSNMAMYARWRDLAASVETVSRIPNLMWTDLASNMFVGTRGWGLGVGSSSSSNFQKRDGAGSTVSEQNKVPVTVYERKILYHWPFAIPAFLSLFLCLMIVVGALVSAWSGTGSPSRVQYYLYRLSSGRLLGSIHSPDECDALAPTNEWIARVGQRPCDLQADGQKAMAATPLVVQQRGLEYGKPDHLAEIQEMKPSTTSQDTNGHVTQMGYVRVAGTE